jgi:hypothetical protein
MSINTPNGILDITNAIVRVSKLEFQQATGFDTVLNNVARNTVLLSDTTEYSSATTYHNWALKLPNAWAFTADVYLESGTDGLGDHTFKLNFFNDTNTAITNGYTLGLDGTSLTLSYDGTQIDSATLPSTLNTGAWRKLFVLFERDTFAVAVDGEAVYHYVDTSGPRPRVYGNDPGYVVFYHEAGVSAPRKIKNLKFINGDKWFKDPNSSNIAYIGGSVGIGMSAPTATLDVAGNTKSTNVVATSGMYGEILGSNAISASTVSAVTVNSNVVAGNVVTTSNLEVGTANLFVDTTTGNVGINTTTPGYDLDVNGDINFTGTFYQGGSPFVSSLWTAGSDSLYYRSNVEVGTANLFVDTTTGNVGLGTDAPLSTLDVRGDYTMGGHIVPSSDSSYDIGSPEFKIRDLFVSNNSMWVGDRTKIAFENGKMKFKRRKIDKVPKVVRELAIAEVADITDEAGVETAAVAYAQQRFPNDGITALADLQLQHWKAYTKSIDDTKEISDIFVDDDEDYEAQSAADAWNEIGSNIYSTHRMTIGSNTEPRVTLDINATDALIVPSGTTDERPSTAVPGMFRYNSTTDYFEMYTTGGWASIATPPSIVSFSPNPIAYANVTTEDITVTGSFFDAQSSVQLEGADETLYDTTNFTFVDNATLTFRIGTLASGQLANRPYKVVVTNGAGLTTKSTGTLGFGSPTITSFSPNSIAADSVSTEDITVSGSFFDAQSVVQLEGANGTLYNTSNFTFVDSTTIRFRTGNSVSAANSPYTIVVTTGLGLSTSSTDTLTVMPPKLTYNGTEYYTGDTFTLTYSRDEHVMTYTQGLKVQFKLYGGAGGKGMWSNNNDDGAPGGYVRANIQFNTDGTFYAYVGQGNVSASGRAGCGGGSTDIRTQKASDASGSVLNSSFITSFYSGMSSALLVAGGGGGAHGGSYGGWGDTNSPGSGGPTTADTNSRGSNDSGHNATGASTTGPGSDGGGSISTSYTCDGVFGGAGTPSNPSIARTDWAVASGTSHTGYGWPNGGSGTSWANGGGGGGYYGGATNWPNGGGGSNFVKSSTNDFTITNLTNSVHNLIEGGKLVITIL